MATSLPSLNNPPKAPIADPQALTSWSCTANLASAAFCSIAINSFCSFFFKATVSIPSFSASAYKAAYLSFIPCISGEFVCGGSWKYSLEDIKLNIDKLLLV